VEEGEPANKIKGGGVRFKDFQNADTARQVYVGVGDLALINPPASEGSARNQQQIRGWELTPEGEKVYPVTLTYDASFASLEATWGLSDSLAYSPIPTDPLDSVADPADWDAIVIRFNNVGFTGAPRIKFTNVKLNVGSSDYPIGDFIDDPGTLTAKSIRNVDLSGGFEISGDLVYDNSGGNVFGKGERSKLEILVIDSGD
jgi:hypothetical protein